MKIHPLPPCRFLACLFAVVTAGFMSSSAFAAFGVSTNGANHIVDTGSGLVFTVNGSGDIRSILFGGKELLDTAKPTGIASGTGATSVTATTTGNTIKLTCDAATLTQYYIVNKGENNIYMATYTTAEPPVGELRFIGRFDYSVLPHGNPAADLSGNVGTVEGSDVFKLANGETRSKFYSAVRFIDDHVHGATGSGMGVYMVISASGYEATSGGPFFKDIDNQAGGDQEIYFYMNSGHSKIEPDRMGLHGPYALCFTSGAAPSASLDMSFMSGLGLRGWVSNRGQVVGSYSGIPTGTQAVVGWANPTAQYWAYGNGGTFASPQMIPGTYTMTLYKNELAVASTSVSVGSGVTTKNIASAESNPATVWQIGDFDGTPHGFMNASLQTFMHPSDVRMHPWSPATYTVGSPISNFPMAEFQLVNDPLTISFTLSSSQVTSHTLRIGTTESFGAARPQITVNPGTSNEFVGPAPGAPVEPYGRSITRGVYHGIYALYTVDIPASAFVAGTNTIQIHVLGKGPYGGFLSASLVYDAIALDGAAGSATAVTGVTVTPASTSVAVGSTSVLSATVSPGNATNKTVSWTSNNPSIASVNAAGVVTGVSAGTATLTAQTQDGGFTASSIVTVTNINIPVTSISVSPATVSVAPGSATTLSVLIAPANATNKAVTWSSSVPAVATVNASGVVTGVAPGSTVVTARTLDGGFTDSTVVTVTSINTPVTGLTLTPAAISLAVGSTASLTAAVTPANATNKTVLWSSSAPTVATVNTSGVVTGIAAGTATITGKTQDGGFTSTSVATVTGGGGGTTCSNAQVVTLPFMKDGVADSCYVTSGTVSFVNSWNMQQVEINGVDFTNTWASSLPPRINGNYYIHYVGNVGWAHFEINGSP